MSGASSSGMFGDEALRGRAVGEMLSERACNLAGKILDRCGLERASAVIRDASPAKQRKIDRIKEQLPSAIEAIGSSLSAGQSLQQSLAYVASNVAEPLASELRKVVWDVNAGKPIGTALQGLERRVPISEIAFLRLAFEVQGRTGGSMREILESASGSLLDTVRFERALHTATAQARLSTKVVGLTPVFLLVLISIMSPGYLGVFFGSGVGFLMFTTALLLDVVGIACIRHMVKVR